MFRPRIDRIEYGGAMIGLKEVKAIMGVILSQKGRRWTVGPESIAFEKELAAVAGVKRAVVTNSGSSALLVAIAALKLPKGSKVIIPACNFPTAFNVLLQNNLMPIVVDVDLTSLNLDLEQVEIAIKSFPDIKAVLAVDIAGNPVDLVELRRIVGKRFIILDDCDGFGTLLQGEMIEKYADISCVSFHAAHIITTGEGGAVLTNSTEIADRALKIREWGRESGSDKIFSYPGFPDDYKERYVYTEIGYNVKPLELQCAMGRIQLRRLEHFAQARLSNYGKLKAVFDKFPDKFTVVTALEDSHPCWFSFPVLIKGVGRKKVMQVLEENNIECRTIFSGNITRHPAYRDSEYTQIGRLPNADVVMRDGMFLSTHPSLTQEMIDFIEEVISGL